jgi:hypothetical protein
VRGRRTFTGWTLAALLTTGAAAATQVKIFETQSQAGFLAGKLRGVSLDALGQMRLAPRATRLTSIGEPFLFAAAAAPKGWVVGTGNSGKVLAVDQHGNVKELLTTAEPEVFAVWVDADGTVFAGSSPHGKVYRVGVDGKTSVFFDPGQTYIWAITRVADGSLLVATGTEGKLFRVDAKGKGQMIYKSEDTHLRSLLAEKNGGVLIGTAGEGLLLRLGPDGKICTLFEAEEPEVVALTAAPDGSVYAAVDASEASLVDLAKDNAAGVNVPGGAGGQRTQGRGAQAAAQETAAEAAPAYGGRRPGAAGPRSELLRITPQGTIDSIWSFPTETVYALLWENDRLWIATGLEGKLYAWSGARIEVEKDVEERQIVALLPGKPGPVFATTNAAAFYRVTAGTESRGVYTSAALDAVQVASFGSFRWRGEVPEGAGVSFSFRTGFSAQPDSTWSDWVSPTAREEGHEIPLQSLPHGRYVQWRGELRVGERAATPIIYGIELSYRQGNLRPKISAFSALEPGQILVPANFNPGNQVYEPAHPTRDGIFTTLEPAATEEAGGRFKPLWKKGYQTLRWTATDPNEDPLVYDLYFRPSVPGMPESPWLKMTTGVEEDHYTFDALALPDGVYRFRLVASDRQANPADTALNAERISDPVVIDHTPPVLLGVERNGDQIKARVRDALSPIREAVYSIDGAEWKAARAEDGLLDAQNETLLIDLPKAEDKAPHLVLLRLTDAAFNVISIDLSAHP